MTLLAPFVALIALAAPPATSRDSAEALVHRIVDAYGGRAALERSRVVRQVGTVTSLMRGETGKLTRVLERPGRLRVEIAYPGGAPEVRVVQGAYGNRDGREVSGSPMHAAMVLQAARLELPLALAQRGAQVADRGTAERDGRTVRVLVQSLPGGMELAVEVDPSTARIVRTVGTLPAGDGRIEFATTYSAFKRFGGVLFATHEENYARGHHTGATDLTSIEVLKQAPAGSFDQEL